MITVIDLLTAVYARRDSSTIASGTKRFGVHAGGRKPPPICKVDLVFLSEGGLDGASKDQKSIDCLNFSIKPSAAVFQKAINCLEKRLKDEEEQIAPQRRSSLPVHCRTKPM